MRPRIRVAVVGGGANCEHEVGLASAASVGAALDPARFEVVPFTVDRDGGWRCPDGRPAAGFAAAVAALAGCDVVFPAVHGPHGEDGTLAALCELAGLPYVGSGVRAGALAMDKWATKLVAGALGIAVAPGRLVTDAADLAGLTTPAVVKPVAAGSSHGVARVDDPAGLAAAVAAALRLDDRVLVEEVVLGREIDVAVLARAGGGRLVGPLLEIDVPPGSVFGTGAKYDGSARFRLPAPLAAAGRDRLAAAALALFDALGCAGVARFDFFWTDAGPVLNEVNTMPGMTEHSQVPRMMAHAGLPYPALLGELVEAALTGAR